GRAEPPITPSFPRPGEVVPQTRPSKTRRWRQSACTPSLQAPTPPPPSPRKWELAIASSLDPPSPLSTFPPPMAPLRCPDRPPNPVMRSKHVQLGRRDDEFQEVEIAVGGNGSFFLVYPGCGKVPLEGGRSERRRCYLRRQMGSQSDCWPVGCRA